MNQGCVQCGWATRCLSLRHELGGIIALAAFRWDIEVCGQKPGPESEYACH